MQIRLLSGICWGAAFIVDQRSKTKTVEKFSKDSPTVFIYRFSGIPASSYPRWSIRCSSENVSKSVECSNARSMDTRQSLKAFYALSRYSVPIIHSSLQHCKLYVFIQLMAQNYGFSWGSANFFRRSFVWIYALCQTEHAANHKKWLNQIFISWGSAIRRSRVLTCFCVKIGNDFPSTIPVSPHTGTKKTAPSDTEARIKPS